MLSVIVIGAFNETKISSKVRLSRSVSVSSAVTLKCVVTIDSYSILSVADSLKLPGYASVVTNKISERIMNANCGRYLKHKTTGYIAATL